MLYLNKHKRGDISAYSKSLGCVYIILICSFGVLIGLYQYRHTKLWICLILK